MVSFLGKILEYSFSDLLDKKERFLAGDDPYDGVMLKNGAFSKFSFHHELWLATMFMFPSCT